MSVNLSHRRYAAAGVAAVLLLAAALYGLSWGGSASAAGTTTISFS